MNNKHCKWYKQKATLATNGVQYAVGEYDNSNNTWTNYTTGTGVGGAGNFDIGKGYQC